jgi:hypothetical protein
MIWRVYTGKDRGGGGLMRATPTVVKGENYNFFYKIRMGYV